MSDLIGIIDHCISEPKISGAINCTAPEPVINRDFTKTLGRLLKRPTLFNLPSVIVEILMGEMGKELLLAGKKVLPVKVQSSGYDFQFSRLENALSEVLGKDSEDSVRPG